MLREPFPTNMHGILVYTSQQWDKCGKYAPVFVSPPLPRKDPVSKEDCNRTRSELETCTGALISYPKPTSHTNALSMTPTALPIASQRWPAREERGEEEGRGERVLLPLAGACGSYQLCSRSVSLAGLSPFEPTPRSTSPGGLRCVLAR